MTYDPNRLSTSNREMWRQYRMSSAQVSHLALGTYRADVQVFQDDTLYYRGMAWLDVHPFPADRFSQSSICSDRLLHIRPLSWPQTLPSPATPLIFELPTDCRQDDTLRSGTLVVLVEHLWAPRWDGPCIAGAPSLSRQADGTYAARVPVAVNDGQATYWVCHEGMATPAHPPTHTRLFFQNTDRASELPESQWPAEIRLVGDRAIAWYKEATGCAPPPCL